MLVVFFLIRINKYHEKFTIENKKKTIQFQDISQNKEILHVHTLMSLTEFVVIKM